MVRPAVLHAALIRFEWIARGSIWVVDATGHAVYNVYKMNPQGQVIMQLGSKGVSGAGHYTSNLPTGPYGGELGGFTIRRG